MGYVMLPVPAHHKKEFERWLLETTARAELAAWNPGRLERAIGRLDPIDVSIVSAVGSIRGYWGDAPTIAERIELDEHAMMDRIDVMNAACVEDSAPHLILVKTAEESRSGRPQLMLNPSIRAELMAALP